MPAPVDPNIALAHGELLAENTTEALRILRHGDWVYKFLKPHDAFPGQSAADRLRQIRLRVRESSLHPEINPLTYDEIAKCLVSRFAIGRAATTREANDLLNAAIATRRGYLIDLHSDNLRVTFAGIIAVDFAVEESHPDWLVIHPSRYS